MWRVRVRLTLMLAAAANATATPAPARHLGLVRTSPSACLSLPRARGGRRRLSNGFRAFQPSSYVTVLGAGSGGEKMVRRFLAATRLAGANARCHSRSPFGFSRWPVRHAPRRHRASPSIRSGTAQAPPVARSGSARFRRTAGRTHQFASAPLHSVSFSQTSIPLHCVPTAANCRDRQRQRCAQRFQRPRCSAYRPRPAIGREATPGQTIGISPRCFARAGHRHYGARLRLSPRTKH